MPMPATLKLVAELAGVAPVTVSRVVNDSENVAAATREKILAIIKDLDYAPNVHAANLRRKRLSDESTRFSKDRLACANERLRAGRNSCERTPYPSEEALVFSPEEGMALAQQMIQLRRELDRLRKHTERIQTCVDMIQEAYSRRLSSCAVHYPHRDSVNRAKASQVASNPG
jgi:transcriptional regulator with XRE-family HTH domain